MGTWGNVFISHLLLVIPMSYPCHYTNVCPHKSQKHVHTCKHTLTIHTQKSQRAQWFLNCFFYTAMGENNGEKKTRVKSQISINSSISQFKDQMIVCVYVCVCVCIVCRKFTRHFFHYCIYNNNNRFWQRQRMVSVAPSPADGVKGFPPLLLSGLKRAVEV